MTDPSVTAPVCYRHPSRETYVRCTRCGRPICPDCMSEASVGHQCPECVAQGRRKTRPALTAFGGTSAGRAGYVTKALVGVNIAVMLLSIAGSGMHAVAGGGWGGLIGGATPLTNAGAVLGLASYDGGVHGVAAGEWYRLFTAMFLHYGLLHLAMNMYALWVLGRNLEAALGPIRFLALYLLAGFGGNVAAYVFTDANVPVAGASTAVFGLFGAIFVILRRLNQSTAQILPVILINVVFTFAVANISKAGHFGGLLVGALVGVILAYAPRAHRTLVQAVGCALVFLALVVVAAYRTGVLTG